MTRDGEVTGEARAFVALDLDDASLDVVAQVAAALGRSAPPGGHLRWTAREKVHVTVRFLGRVSDGVLAAMGDAVRTLGSGRASLAATLGSIGGFPSRARATVLVGMLEDATEALGSLARAFEERAVALGEPPEPRPYRPHVTLARLRSLRDIGPWIERIAFAPAELRLVSLSLYRSDQGPSGAVYSPIVRVPLA